MKYFATLGHSTTNLLRFSFPEVLQQITHENQYSKASATIVFKNFRVAYVEQNH